MIEEKKIDVGPFWGNNEADEKVKKYMAKNNMLEEGWHWSGSWSSDWGITSYAVFWRLKDTQVNQTSTHGFRLVPSLRKRFDQMFDQIRNLQQRSVDTRGGGLSEFGERVNTFFSTRMWNHARRPTTGHSVETIEIIT